LGAVIEAGYGRESICGLGCWNSIEFYEVRPLNRRNCAMVSFASVPNV
jgi:hypothetical protein